MDRHFVREKLTEKKRQDPDCRAFAVQRHRYKLARPIADARVSALESQYGISLPEDYRQFITEVSNGGAGPGYGLYSIECALTGKGDRNYRRSWDGVDDRIALPFVRPDSVDAGEFDDDRGLLLLCQHGCANDDFLVLNGVERGFVWEYIEWVGHHLPRLKKAIDYSSTKGQSEDQRDAAWVNFHLSATDDEKMTFWDWYLDWLQKAPVLKDQRRRSWLQRLGLGENG
ncbi:MAG: SMI1/KNR4 family protein [Pseudomonadota bacterium]